MSHKNGSEALKAGIVGWLIGVIGFPVILMSVGVVSIVMFVLMIGSSTMSAGGCATAVTGDNNTQKTYNYLMQSEFDLKPFQAAAIVGNFIHESGGDPLKTNNPNPTSGAVGIAQWLGSRQTALKAHNYQGKTWTDIDFQLDFMKSELFGGWKSALIAVRRSTTIEEATVIFEKIYEVSGDTGSYPKRIKNAKNVLEKYGKSASSNLGCVSVAVSGTLTDPGKGPQNPKTGLVPRSENLQKFIFANWGCEKLHGTPCIREIGGYSVRPAGTPQDHTLGLALDITVSDGIGKYPSPTEQSLGWQIACFLASNASKVGVRYLIWQGKIWNVTRLNEGNSAACQLGTGWRPYTYGYGVTEGHYDHVHVTVQPGVGG